MFSALPKYLFSSSFSAVLRFEYRLCHVLKKRSTFTPATVEITEQIPKSNLEISKMGLRVPISTNPAGRSTSKANNVIANIAEKIMPINPIVIIHFFSSFTPAISSLAVGDQPIFAHNHPVQKDWVKTNCVTMFYHVVLWSRDVSSSLEPVIRRMGLQNLPSSITLRRSGKCLRYKSIVSLRKSTPLCIISYSSLAFFLMN